MPDDRRPSSVLRLRRRAWRPRLAALRACSALGLALGLPAGAGAAEAPDADVEAAAVITVYATRAPREAFSYPGMVSVLDRAELDIAQPSDLADLFRAMPFVQVSGGPRRTGQVPAVRGFARENVVLLLDGARQSFISAHDGRIFLDPELLKRAEVVRGPASALYGSGAIGGVIAFETADAVDLLRPGERAGLRLRGGIETASREWLMVGTAAARTAGAGASFIGSLGVRQSGDIRLASGLDLSSDDRIATWLLKGDVVPAAGVRLEAGWIGFANRALEPNNGQGLNLGGGSGTLADVEKKPRSDTLRATLELAPPGRPWLDAVLTLYRTETAVAERELAGGRRTLREIATTGITVRNRAVLFGAAEAGSRGALLLGLDWYRDRQIGTDSAAPSGSRDGVPDGRSEFLGAYAQMELDLERPLGLPGAWTLVPGLRFDRFESRSPIDQRRNRDSQWSARLAAGWRPVPALFLFGSWGEGFRAPSINELYLTGVHFPLPHPVLGQRRPPVFVTNNFVPNPDLRPEKAQTVEAGAALRFGQAVRNGGRLELKAAWWQTQVRDLIDLFVDVRFPRTCFAPPAFAPCSAGTTESGNVAEATLEGVDLELAWTGGRVDLLGAFGHIAGREQGTGRPLGVLAPDRGSLEARLRLPEASLLLGTRLEAAARFDRGRNPDDIRPGYATLDLYVAWIPPFAPATRLDLRLDNLLDRKVERTFAGVVEPGRSLRLALTTRFGG